MTVFIKNQLQAFAFLELINEFGRSEMTADEINHLIELILRDLNTQEADAASTYLDEVFESVPSNSLLIIIDELSNIGEPLKSAQYVAMHLLYTDRPIFQIKGLKLIERIADSDFVPHIIPLMFSSYTPLQLKAIELISTLEGNAEEILEQYLQNRSMFKRNLSAQVLMKLNPTNPKLAPFLLESEDFVERIEGIRVLAANGERRLIAKIEPFLQDSDMAVVKAAIEAIAALGGRRAMKTLLAKLTQEDLYTPLKTLISKLIEDF